MWRVYPDLFVCYSIKQAISYLNLSISWREEILDYIFISANWIIVWKYIAEGYFTGQIIQVQDSDKFFCPKL